MLYTTNTPLISTRNNIRSPQNQQAVFAAIATSANNVMPNPNTLSSSISSPTVLLNKKNEINLFTANNRNQIQHSQIQQTIQQIETSSSTSSMYLINGNESDPILHDNQTDIMSSVHSTSTNLMDTRNKSALVNQVESLLNMAMNEAPLGQVDFAGNYEDAQTHSILGNHQLMRSNMSLTHKKWSQSHIIVFFSK